MKATTQGIGDYVLVEGQRSPGLADVAGSGPPHKWNVQNGFGLAGATLVFGGEGLAKFPITFRLYGHPFEDLGGPDPDWVAWYEFEKVLQRAPTGKYPKAKAIWHPFLERHKITAVVFEDITFPEQTDAGEWKIVVQCLQYRKPKFRFTKPDGTKDKPSDDPWDREIERLTAQVQDLSNG